MRAIGEIVLPQTKPQTEWILDRPVQKASPTFKHSQLQAAFLRALEDWAGDRGAVGPEWRFRASPPGEDIRPVVPDVAYLSYERMRPLSAKDRDVPPIARILHAYDSTARYERIDGSVVSYSPPIVPNLSLPLRAMFARLDIPEHL